MVNTMPTSAMIVAKTAIVENALAFLVARSARSACQTTAALTTVNDVISHCKSGRHRSDVDQLGGFRCPLRLFSQFW